MSIHGLGTGKTVDVVCLDFSKAFDIASPNTVPEKLWLG